MVAGGDLHDAVVPVVHQGAAAACVGSRQHAVCVGGVLVALVVVAWAALVHAVGGWEGDGRLLRGGRGRCETWPVGGVWWCLVLWLYLEATKDLPSRHLTAQLVSLDKWPYFASL